MKTVYGHHLSIFRIDFEPRGITVEKPMDIRPKQYSKGEQASFTGVSMALSRRGMQREAIAPIRQIRAYSLSVDRRRAPVR